MKRLSDRNSSGIPNTKTKALLRHRKNMNISIDLKSWSGKNNKMILLKHEMKYSVVKSNDVWDFSAHTT